MRILVTGGAGFIGFHTTMALLAAGHSVLAVDEINDYYDPALKLGRLAQIGTRAGFQFVKADIAADGALLSAAGSHGFDVVLHLAAQAGVRNAVSNPDAYTRANLV